MDIGRATPQKTPSRISRISSRLEFDKAGTDELSSPQQTIKPKVKKSASNKVVKTSLQSRTMNKNREITSNSLALVLYTGKKTLD